MKTTRHALSLIAALSALTSYSSAARADVCYDLFNRSGAGTSARVVQTSRKPKKDAQPDVAVSPELAMYESARDPRTVRQLKNYRAEHGLTVTSAAADGTLTARLRVLVDNPDLVGKIRIVGAFNNWGATARPGDTLKIDPRAPEFQIATVKGLRNGEPYMLEVDGKLRVDPASREFTNSEDGSIQSVVVGPLAPLKNDFVDLGDQPVIIGEVEIASLVQKFKGGPAHLRDTYKFITESGVIDRLKAQGYNTIEMLPFNQAMDGADWRNRYQVYGLFAPDANFGTPAEFKKMIDAFHERGIAIMMDVVVSHFPDHARQPDTQRDINGVGLSLWTKKDGSGVYAAGGTPWGTRRYDYANPLVRKYLVDSIMHMMSEYGIDGLRVDNVDSNGIIDLPGGREFLREMNIAARKVNPRAVIIGEAFAPIDELVVNTDQGGIGFNALNDGNLFEGLRRTMQSDTQGFNLIDLSHRIRNAFEWKRAPLMRYSSNHDEAANPREGYTGQYPGSMLGSDDYYAFGKILASEVLTMTSGAYHLSMPQTRVLQKGNFSWDPAIDWAAASGGFGKRLDSALSAVSHYMTHKGSFFGFKSLRGDIEHMTDNTNKVIVLRRVDPATGRQVFILINFSHLGFKNYEFGMDYQGLLKIALDTNAANFGGDSALATAAPMGLLRSSGRPMHSKKSSVSIPVVAPYSAVFLETE